MTTIDQVKDQAQEQAGVLAGRAKGLIVGQIDERSTQLGSTVVEHSQSVREIGDQLRARGQLPAANVADTIASQLEKIGFYLSETDGERIVADAESLARRQPMLTLAAGVAAGLFAARLLKAGATQRYSYYAQAPQARYESTVPGRSAGLSYYED